MRKQDSSNYAGNRKISIVAALLVGGLALASFSLSFDALRKLAVEQNAVPSHLGWVFPIVVDGAIVVFSLAALEASLRKQAAGKLRLLVFGVTAGSVFFNINHVPDGSSLSKVLAATPPVLLFFSFEVLMHLVKDQMEQSLQEQRQQEADEAEKVLSKDERLQAVRKHLSEGLSAQEIVEQIPNVSLRTIQRDVGEIERKTD